MKSSLSRARTSCLALFLSVPALADGPALPWAAVMPAGSLSTVSLPTGNLHTSLPLARNLKGVGPTARVRLCNNSRNVSLGSQPELGFGAGWSLAVLDHLDLSDPLNAVLHTGTGHAVTFQGSASEPGFDLVLTQSGTSWIVVDERGVEREFDASGDPTRGRMVVLRDPNGFELTFSYASTGLLALMTEEAGRSMSFHDTDGDLRIDRIVDDKPGGASFTLSYSTGGISRVSVSAGPDFSFGYRATGEIEWIEDPDDDDQDGAPNRWIYTYDSSGRVAKVDDPAPHATSRSLQWDMVGSLERVRAKERSGTITTFFFDASGRLTSTLDALGFQQTFKYDANHSRTGYVNEEGHAWDTTVDAFGNRTRVVGPNGLEFRATYDSANRTTSLSNLVGPTATFRYLDPHYPNRISEWELPADGLGNPAVSTRLEYFDPGAAGAGQFESYEGPNGVLTTIAPTVDGLPQVQTLGDGFGKPVVSEFVYGTRGTLYDDVLFTPDTTTSSAPGFPSVPAEHPALVAAPFHSSISTSDWAGSQTSTTTSVGSGILPIGSTAQEPVESVSVDRSYDFLGRLVSRVETDSQATETHGLPAATYASSVQYFDASVPGMPFGGSILTRADGSIVTVAYDVLGRTQTVNSTGAETTTYAYAPDGLVASRTHGIGMTRTRVRYEYRADNLLDSMILEHTQDGGSQWVEQRRVDFDYDAAGLESFRAEYHTGTLVALTQSVHDAREQLVWEKRSGTNEYNRIYFYDQGGNRTDTYLLDQADQVVEHRQSIHDVSAPSFFGSRANRLMAEIHKDGSGSLLRTRWYDYDNTHGNVSEVVEKTEGSPWYVGTAIRYDERGDLVFAASARLVLQRRWQLDGAGEVDPATVEWLRAVEMRQSDLYLRDGLIEREPNTLIRLDADPGTYWSDASAWGRAPELDSTLDVVTGQWFIEALHRAFVSEVRGGAEVLLAGDTTGNVLWQFDVSSGILEDETQTAFGENLTGPPSSRYAGFSGMVGAESGLLPNGWVRIGARLYDPAIGRWLQSDPISLGGGMNTYEYCVNSPRRFNDPSGLQSGGPSFSPQPGVTYRVTSPPGPAVYDRGSTWEWTEPGELESPLKPVVVLPSVPPYSGVPPDPEPDPFEPVDYVTKRETGRWILVGRPVRWPGPIRRSGLRPPRLTDSQPTSQPSSQPSSRPSGGR